MAVKRITFSASFGPGSVDPAHGDQVAWAARGLAVAGIELSPHMAGRLAAKPGTEAVTIGDMTTTRVPGTFTLLYLVANTIMNVTTQDEQLAVFAEAAAHLAPDGCFVAGRLGVHLRA